MWDAVDVRLEIQDERASATGAASGSRVQAVRALAAASRLVPGGAVVFVGMPASLAPAAYPLHDQDAQLHHTVGGPGAAPSKAALSDMLDHVHTHGYLIAPISQQPSAPAQPMLDARTTGRLPQECAAVVGLSSAQTVQSVLVPALRDSAHCAGSGDGQRAFEPMPHVGGPGPSASACPRSRQQPVIMVWPHQQHFRAPKSPLSRCTVPCALIPPAPGAKACAHA